MSRVTYNDIFSGAEDEDLLAIFGSNNSDKKRRKIRKMLMEVIENELTPKQREVITDYYFNHINIPEIARKQGVSGAAVSAKIIAGKRRIQKFMKYCIKCDMCQND
ncbi:MAG: sigma-70 family RNA polymerase sigma factor [Ruminococcus sp.]|nr:sigma-70 family RNA polymerase sigma factor [Ruminococcus sp.]MDE7138394.1 sigma-70 family RNA polymerase sigma factor [Ruminococcus sp.]